MDAGDISQQLNFLDAKRLTGTLSIFGDSMPAPLNKTVSVKTTQALDDTLLIHFADGCLISIREPGGFICSAELMGVAKCKFLRAESFHAGPPRFLVEFSTNFDGISKSVDGADFWAHCGAGNIALELKVG